MGKHAPIGEDQMQARRHRPDMQPHQEDDRADHEEQNQGADLDQGEPEFHQAEPFDGGHVGRADNSQGRQGERPLGHAVEGSPVSHIEGHGGDIDNAGHGPVQVVHPAGDIGALLAQKLPRIGDEAAGGRAVHDQLAQRPKDEEGKGAADEIDHRQSRSRQLQPRAGAQKQARANGAANGDHLHLQRFQRLVIAMLMMVKGMGIASGR